MHQMRIAALCLLGVIVATQAQSANQTLQTTPSTWKPVELSSSAIFISLYEIIPTQRNGSSDYYMCYDMINNAKPTNSKAIQLVPTIHWKGTDTRVDSYCYRDSSYKCQDVTDSWVQAFQNGIQKCIQYAVDNGFTTISMLPHLDNDAQYYWRNKAWFDPLQMVKGVTYQDILVTPVAKAMNAVAKASKTPVTMYLTLEGETGKAIVFGPRSWILSFQQAKDTMTKDLSADQAKNMKVGISMNHNQICACINFNNIRKADFANTYAKEINSVISSQNIRFDYAGMQALYKMVDFIGLSSYPALNAGDAEVDFESPQKMNMFELSFFGVYVQQMTSQGKEVIVSETGIGGGDAYGGIEKNATKVALNPFFGLWAAYSKSSDPWSVPDNAEYRRSLYKKYLAWLAKGTGPKVHISHVFTWSGGSWDVLGTHYDSTNAQGSFRDDEIFKWVAEHNAMVNAQK